MNYLLIAAGVIAAMVLLTNLFSDKSKEKKVHSGNCRNCPEFRYCGGGRPRCSRRGELKK